MQYNEVTAIFSPCRRYRYLLRRSGGLLSSDNTCLFIMLNPSTADEIKNDPTINRCIGYAHMWGFRTLEVVNIFALRSTDPAELSKADDPIGPHNDGYITDRLAVADCIIAAWGNHGGLLGRSGQMHQLLANKTIKCLGINKSGEPKHPLYVSSRQELRDYQFKKEP